MGTPFACPRRTLAITVAITTMLICSLLWKPQGQRHTSKLKTKAGLAAFPAMRTICVTSSCDAAVSKFAALRTAGNSASYRRILLCEENLTRLQSSIRCKELCVLCRNRMASIQWIVLNTAPWYCVRLSRQGCSSQLNIRRREPIGSLRLTRKKNSVSIEHHSADIEDELKT